MNKQQWGDPESGGGVQMGPVRRTRERMEADLQEGANFQSQSQNLSRPQMPSALAEGRSAQGPIGVAISKPTPVAQWPLADETQKIANNVQYRPPAGRQNPPQRPPRPSRVPSILDASRLQDPTPSFQYKPRQPEQNLAVKSQGRYSGSDESPVVTSPMTPSSRQSTNSSIGTIPDFPVPMMPPQAVQPPVTVRRNPGLGPPPSTRRGTSSYYSQTSLVSPIPEESQGSQTPDKAHDSYASSAAIPMAWDANSSRLDDDFDDRDNMYEGQGYGSGYWPHETIEEGRESRESNLDDSDDRGLIRSASLGKRAKPSMVTTKPLEKQGQRSSLEAEQQPKSGKMGAAALGAAAGAALAATATKDGQREVVWPMMGFPDSPLASGTGFIDSNSSEEEISQISKPATVNSNHAVSSIQPKAPFPEQGAMTPSFNRRLSEMRRPRKLDIDAVRDAEARGSLTSLPELIRRATRLAAMIDRGKRPGSRLHDLNDFANLTDMEKGRQFGRKCTNISLVIVTNRASSTTAIDPLRDACCLPSSWPCNLKP